MITDEPKGSLAEIAIRGTFPLHFYEGLHDQVISLPATDVPCPDQFDLTHTGSEVPEATFTSPVPLGRNMMQDCVAVEECYTALNEAMLSLQDKLASNATDQNFLREGFYNTRLTNTSIVKKRKRGTIAVQPEAVKRRK
ncbi:Hypothetical predicted protein, partial [Paramuricea clavata]